MAMAQQRGRDPGIDRGRQSGKRAPNPDNGIWIEPMVRLMRWLDLRVGYRPTRNFRNLVGALARRSVVIVHLDGDHPGVIAVVCSTSFQGSF